MQTTFTPAQLQDPAMQSSEKILRTCVHCGFCTATCPTYLVLGDELDSPRGRIYMIKDMFENNKPATPEVVKHLDRCLSCLSCMSTCPSGVNYMHLIDHARAYIEETHARPWHDRMMRSVLAAILPYPQRFRFALGAARLGAPFQPLIARVPVLGKRLGAMLALAPKQLPNRSAFEGPAVYPAAANPSAANQPQMKKRVALLSGCAQSVIGTEINEAAIRLLTRHGVEVVLPKDEGCCGALTHHMGKEESAKAFARRLIDAWIAEIEGAGLEAIIITASGCGTSIKDYGHLFRNEPAYAEKAAHVAALAKDVTEYLGTLPLAIAAEAQKLSVAYHSACSMQHGQQIKEAPKKLLQKAGFTVRDVPEGHICCGSAGTYNLLQPEISGQLRTRKIENINKTGADIIATGNIGCMTQIGYGFDQLGRKMPVVHTIELLDWATGGKKPAALEGF